MEPRPVGHLDSLGELVERQPSREEMLAQRNDRLLTIGLGDTLGRMIQRLTTLTRSVELGEARPRTVSIPSSGARDADRLATYPNAYPRPLAGRLERHTITSACLEGNPLGDPADRPVEVYVPPGYDDDPERRYPSVYVIQGYTGALPGWHNRSPFRPTFPEAADALFASGGAPPCVVV